MRMRIVSSVRWIVFVDLLIVRSTLSIDGLTKHLPNMCLSAGARSDHCMMWKVLWGWSQEIAHTYEDDLRRSDPLNPFLVQFVVFRGLVYPLHIAANPYDTHPAMNDVSGLDSIKSRFDI